MRDYVIKPGMRGMFSINTETNEYDVIDYMQTNIDWVYQIPEDGVVHIHGGDDKKEVKKDDILILFYSAPYVKHQAVIINSEEWKENIASKKEYENSKKESMSCEYCDSCENCG